MIQRYQWQLRGGEQGLAEKAWLASLVQTFEAVSRDPMKPCDPAAMASLKARLSRPATAMAVSFVALH